MKRYSQFFCNKVYILYRDYFGKKSVKAAINKYSEMDIDLYEEETKLLLKLNKENPMYFSRFLAKSPKDDGYYLATELAEQSLDTFIKKKIALQFGR